MKLFSVTLILIVFMLTISAQEWKNLKTYQKATSNNELIEGNWLQKDRKQQSEKWQQACKYNIANENGFQKYHSIKQIRDFYLFFDAERRIQGHEVKWGGIAAIAANQLCLLENDFIRIFIVHNKEIVNFAHEGSEKVFKYAFPRLKKVFFSPTAITGEDALKWDVNHGMIEQCEILTPIYANLSQKSLNRLEKMAKGKGIYTIGVPKKLKYKGEINDCQARFEHGMTKLVHYCQSKHRL
ncbi:MAG: hypothetical protein PF517_04250 [Salinivirgaceae bacterium]|jgi:hypothetical protein|nr:hypothetical protein [Salinivirgaceae bacterium]